MKLSTITTISLFCILMVGCQESVQRNSTRQLINTELVNSLSDIQMQNAIITQHTLFPYHFVKNGAELNELGQRDLAILAGHFMEHPGQLNIRRNNNIPGLLYEARVNLVLGRLKETSVNTERIRISEGMPGGSGMLSEKVLIILEKQYTVPAAEMTTDRLEIR